MQIEELLDSYSAAANAASSAVPPNTVLSAAAQEILEMVVSYAGDSAVFLASGDRVNAFAAAAYGAGWLDCGGYLGYTSAPLCSVPNLVPEFPESLMEKLTEKTERYDRMLTEALRSVVPAPDPETAAYRAARDIYTRAGEMLYSGHRMIPEDMVNALSRLSYGYGWLDCGLRAGLYTVTGDRHLFTI